jgi:hypothetical protein
VPVAPWTPLLLLLAGMAGAAIRAESPHVTLRGGAPAAAVAADTDTLRLRWLIVRDTQMTGHPVEAVRLLVPAGWQSAGQLHWSDRNVCIANLVQMTASANSPDGLMGFEIFTPFSWQWVDDSMSRLIQRRAAAAPGGSSAFCPLAEVMSPADYIRRAILPRLRAGAREIAAEAMPGLAATVQSQMETVYAPLLATHRYTSVHGDAGRVKIAYATGGHPVEEWIMATIEVVAYPQYAPMPKKPGDKTQAYSVSATHIYAYRAPAGALASQSTLAATIVNSIRANPEWLADRDRLLKQLLQRQIGIVDRRETNVRSGPTTDTAAAVPRPDSATPLLFGEFASATHGLTAYTDPATRGVIALDASRHAWSNGAGDYFLSAGNGVGLERVPAGPWVPLKPRDP